MGTRDDIRAALYAEQAQARADMREAEERIERAVKLAREYGGIDGAHHKDWVLNRMVQELTGGRQSLPQKGSAP